jgi:hypothetical protein
MFKKIIILMLICATLPLSSARRIPAPGEEPAEIPAAPAPVIPALLPVPPAPPAPPAPAPAPVIPALLPVPPAPAEPASPGEAKEQKEKESKERETKEREVKKEETKSAAIPDTLIVHVPAQYKIPGKDVESINTNEADPAEAGIFTYKELFDAYSKTHHPLILARVVYPTPSGPGIKYYDAYAFSPFFMSTGQTPDRITPIWDRTMSPAQPKITFYIYDSRKPEKGLQFLETAFALLPEFQDIFVTTNPTQQTKAQVHIAIKFEQDRKYDFAFLFSKAALHADDKIEAEAKAIAQIILGIIYYFGDSVPQSYATAFSYFEPASKQDVNAEAKAVAQEKLGQMYYMGNPVQRDYKIAFSYFESASIQDASPSAKLYAQTSLALMYYYGNGVEKDYITARRYFEPLAAQTQNPEIQSLAQKFIEEINQILSIEKPKPIRKGKESKEEAATPEARGTKRKPDDEDPNTRGQKRPEPGQS